MAQTEKLVTSSYPARYTSCNKPRSALQQSTMHHLTICLIYSSSGIVIETAIPQDVPKSTDTFELQVAQQHFTVALPKAPGTYTLPVAYGLSLVVCCSHAVLHIAVGARPCCCELRAMMLQKKCLNRSNGIHGGTGQLISFMSETLHKTADVVTLAACGLAKYC